METTTHPDPPPYSPGSALGTPALRRPREGRLVAGVAAGLAEHLGLDVLVVRLVLAALCVLGGFGIPLYLAGWLLIPDEGSDVSVAESLLRPRQSN
jgi:phage shock protein PspC (stress-responsive transcriptional regulator)